MLAVLPAALSRPFCAVADGGAAFRFAGGGGGQLSGCTPQSAGVIHTNLERGFIRAQTIAFDDFIRYGGEHGAKEAGKMRAERKDYVVKTGTC